MLLNTLRCTGPAPKTKAHNFNTATVRKLFQGHALLGAGHQKSQNAGTILLGDGKSYNHKRHTKHFAESLRQAPSRLVPLLTGLLGGGCRPYLHPGEGRSGRRAGSAAPPPGVTRIGALPALLPDWPTPFQVPGGHPLRDVRTYTAWSLDSRGEWDV